MSSSAVVEPEARGTDSDGLKGAECRVSNAVTAVAVSFLPDYYAMRRTLG